MIEEVLNELYSVKADSINELSKGVGGKTYIVCSGSRKYILKNPDKSELNNPELEPDICQFLEERGIPAPVFIQNHGGEYISKHGKNIYTLLSYVEGDCYGYNEAL